MLDLVGEHKIYNIYSEMNNNNEIAELFFNQFITTDIDPLRVYLVRLDIDEGENMII